MVLLSESKLRANQANARRSTGPRSAAGKAASRFNALKHGLCAAQAVMPSEPEEAFEALRDDLAARLAPDSEAERLLVEQAARELWRLRRAGVSETGALRQLADPYMLQSEGDDPVRRELFVLGATLRQDFGEAGFIDKLSRYETRSARALERALGLLERLRALEPPPKPRKSAEIGFVPPDRSPPPTAAPSEEGPPPFWRFPAEFGFVPQNRAGLFGSASAVAIALDGLTRPPEIRWPPGWERR